MIETLHFFLIATQAIGTLLAVGLELAPADLKQTLSDTRPVVVGLLINLLVLPLATILLLTVLTLPTAVAAGVLLSGVCAGGNSAVLLTRNVQGDTAYAVTLLCLLNLLSLLVLPPLLAAVAGPLHLGSLPASAVAQQVLSGLLIYMLVPLAVGMSVRARWPAFAARWAPRCARVANLSLLALILGVLAAYGGKLDQFGLASLSAMTVLVLLSFMLARGVAPATSGLGRAALYVCGIRNLSLALLLSQMLQLPALAMLTILTYGLVMYLISAALWWRLRVNHPAL